MGDLKVLPIKFDLKPGAKPYHACAFPIPKAYENLTKEECCRFEELDIWEHTCDSEWAAPTFIVPKKTSDIQVVTDFQLLNKLIIRKPYPLPKIQDLLQKLKKFKYATALDLKQNYYSIRLDKETSKMCITIFLCTTTKETNY